jgi:hypothetical protein
VQAVTASSSSAPPPMNDRMSIQLTGERPIARFNVLIDQEIKNTKWACPTTINHLGITNDFNLLCKRVGLSPFVFQDVPTYRWLILELLSTLTHNVNSMPPCNEVQGAERVKFRLMNHDFDLSFTEWCASGSSITTHTSVGPTVS